MKRLMMPDTLTPITTTDALAALCVRLGQADYVALDTEFIREKTYWPQLCLVQVAGAECAAAIDPLAPGLDLTPLYELLVNERVLKVLHAGRQDIEIFVQRTGRVPTPLFDTQIAAMVCGFGESVSYEMLVSRLAREQVDKSSRYTDWAQRPLSSRQLTYALADVIHLRPVYEKLVAQLEKRKRNDWLCEELAALTDPGLYQNDPEQAWRRLKPRNTRPRHLALVQALAAWREREAQTRDIPRGRVLRDETILELAAHPPTTVDDLLHNRSFSRGTAEGPWGEAILAAVARARALPEAQCPQIPPRPEPDPELAVQVDLLRLVLKMKGEEHDVAPRLIADGSDLEAIIRNDQAAVPALTGWRRTIFGEAALDLKHGRLALTITDGRVSLAAVTPAQEL